MIPPEILQALAAVSQERPDIDLTDATALLSPGPHSTEIVVSSTQSIQLDDGILPIVTWGTFRPSS